MKFSYSFLIGKKKEQENIDIIRNLFTLNFLGFYKKHAKKDEINFHQLTSNATFYDKKAKEKRIFHKKNK